jgi:hypothetical protein
LGSNWNLSLKIKWKKEKGYKDIIIYLINTLKLSTFSAQIKFVTDEPQKFESKLKFKLGIKNKKEKNKKKRKEKPVGPPASIWPSKDDFRRPKPPPHCVRALCLWGVGPFRQPGVPSRQSPPGGAHRSSSPDSLSGAIDARTTISAAMGVDPGISGWLLPPQTV